MFSLLSKRIKRYFEDWAVYYLLIVFISCFSSFAVQMLSTGLPLYCIDIGKTTAQSGVFAGFYSAAVILSRPFVGKWTDEKGKWNVTFAGMILLVAAVAGMAFVPELSLFSIYHVMEGLAFSALSTAIAALMVDILPQDAVARSIALFTVVKSFGISLGASYAVSFTEKHGSDKIFICAFFILLGVLVLTVLLRKKPKSAMEVKRVQNDVSDLKGIERYVYKKALPMCLIQFVFTFSLTLGTCYLPSYSQSIGLEGVGAYYIVSAVTMLLARTVLSKIIDRLPRMQSFVIGMLLAAATTVGILFTNDLIYLVLLSIPNAIGISMINPLLNVMSTGNVEQRRRGVASSTYYASLDLGSGAGSTIWGLLVPLIGYRVSFISATVLLLLVSVYGIKILNMR